MDSEMIDPLEEMLDKCRYLEFGRPEEQEHVAESSDQEEPPPEKKMKSSRRSEIVFSNLQACREIITDTVIYSPIRLMVPPWGQPKIELIGGLNH